MGEYNLSSDEIGGFRTVRISNEKEPGRITFRAAIFNEEDAKKWLEDFSLLNWVSWNVYQTYPNPVRLAYHKLYECRYGAKNKKLPEGTSNVNHNCKVKLDLRIKLITVDTKKKDKYLRESPPLPGIIQISGEHSHHIICSDVAKFNRPGITLREKFLTYFVEKRLSPALALRYHESLLLALENGRKLLGSGNHTPLPQTVYWWHRVWRLAQLGSFTEPLETLQHKIHLYEQEGVVLRVRSEKPWAVVLATPIMLRAQQSYWSKHIIFVDTSASCDATSCNVTLMMSATKAGAVPNAILIHEAQTTESYELAFSLYKSTFPNSFGGGQYPVVFMTDNSAAEKNALKAVWPESIQILCDFHVASAEWQWLQSNADGGSRQALMKAFQKIQYATCTEHLEESIEAVKELSPEYYANRVEGLLDTKEQWVRLYRAELPIGGSHTNNYSEASVRILKDVILDRTKAFNVVALVDYIAEGWEKYLVSKLCRYAYRKDSKPKLLYNDLVTRMPAEMADKIVIIDDDTYHVPCSKTGEPTYEVIVSTGMCTCKAGSAGSFCKHQALVNKKFGRLFPNQPLVTSADCYLLGKLAMGDECPDKTFFLKAKETLEDFEKDLANLLSLYAPPATSEIPMDYAVENEAVVMERPDSPAPEEEENVDGEAALLRFTANCERLFNLGTETNKRGFVKFMNRASNSMEKINTHNKAFDVMMKIAQVVKPNLGRSGLRIPVQPAAIARRRPGLTRGSAKCPSGRPLKGEGRKPKRPRRLAASINVNKAHFKKH